MTLDANSMVWTFNNWGRPSQLVSPLLNCSSPETTPVQVECSLEFAAILTGSGDVYAVWPLCSAFVDTMAELDKDESTKAIVPDGGTVIPCYTWEVNIDPVKLPILPKLPTLPATGLPEEECRKETKLIKIAAFSDCLVGLTNKGHVLKIDGLGKGKVTGTWCYVSKSAWMIWHPFLNYDAQLPNYSEIDKVKKHKAFLSTTGNINQQRPPQAELLSDTMLITHVSCISSITSESCI